MLFSLVGADIPAERPRTDTVTHGGKNPVSHDDFSTFMATLAGGESLVPDFSQFVKEPIYQELEEIKPQQQPVITKTLVQTTPKQTSPERVLGIPDAVREWMCLLDGGGVYMKQWVCLLDDVGVST